MPVWPLDDRVVASLLAVFVGVVPLRAVVAQVPCGYEIAAVIQGPFCPFFGYPLTLPQDIGEDGTVVGYYNQCSVGPSRPFRWRPETGLVTLPLPTGFTSGAAWGYDDATGWIVGEVDGPGTDGPFAARWQGNSPQNLGTLPEGDYSNAAASSNGRIVGRWGNEITGPQHAFLWEDGLMIDLGPDLGTPNSEAMDVNAAGQIVGWMGTFLLGETRAFIWDSGVVVALPNLLGTFGGRAGAISADGQMIVGAAQFDDGSSFGLTRGIVWRQGEPQDLGTLPGFTRSGASDLNDSGTVVGAAAGPGVQVAFVWYDGVMVDLNTLIPPDAGIRIFSAPAINNARQIACEADDLINADVVGILLSPVASPLGDLTCDGRVLADDLSILIDSWGPCRQQVTCPADLDGDGAVGILDLFMMFANWG